MGQPIDGPTYRDATEVLQIAQRHGLDPIESLHRADLILTPARDKVIRLQAMNFMLRQVLSWMPHEFLRRKFSAEHPASPKDMYSCITEFMEETIAWWEKEQ